MKRVLSLLFMLSLSLFINAQNTEYIKETVQKIIPPSPSAFEFSRFGNIPLNGSTGGFSYNVPIYTIQSGDISLPISMGYYSNGVRIDDLSGIVGTNWTLNAGGVISRIVRDYPDELSGYNGRLYPSSNETFSPIDNADDIKNIARDTGSASFYDGEQDWFSFNVNGISGSFYFDKDLVPHILSDQSLKITYEIVNGFRGFTIIDEKGYKYIFGGNASSIETKLNYNQCDSYENIEYKTAWFLTKIVSPTNNFISFDYVSNDFYYSDGFNATKSRQGTCYPSLLTDPAISECLNANSIWSKVLTKISFQNNSVLFNYNSQRQDSGGKSLKEIKVLKNTELIKQIDFNYDMIESYISSVNPSITAVNETGTNYRMFLKEIIFKGNHTVSNYEKYSFDYYNKNELPARLTYSKDKFGYNNGSINTSPFSNKLIDQQAVSTEWLGFTGTANMEVNPDKVYYGMLKKINYPTGGYTEVSYEANRDAKISDSKVPNEHTIGIIKYCGTGVTPVTGSFEFISNGLPLNIEDYADYAGGMCASNPNTIDRYKIQIYKDNQIILDEFRMFGINYNNNPISTTAGSTCKIIMTLLKEGVLGNVKIKYNGDFIEETVYGAGVRVKEITDNSNDDEYNKRKFYYNKLSDYLSNNTTMQHAFEPYYNKTSPVIIWCPITLDPVCFQYSPTRIYVYSATSNPVNLGYLTREPINYSAITEIFESDNGKNGAIEKVFLSNMDSPARLYEGTDIYGSSPDNLGELLKDKIQKETVYDAVGVIKSKKSFSYRIFNDNFLTAITARKNFIFPWEEDWKVYFGDVCYDPTLFSPLANYSVWTYKNYYGIVKLDSITETKYFDDNEIMTTSTNTYGDQPFFLLNSNLVTNSKGETIKTEYRYPFDLVGVEQTPYMQQLVEAHRIGDPVITKIFKNNIKLSENHTKFENSSYTSNLLLPKEIFTKKGILELNINVSEDRKLVFNQYDDLGNVQQYTPENGTAVSVIWGYNKTQPIAKIENATYSQVTSYVSNLQTLSDTGSEASLLTALNNLRNDSALSNAMVTTYTFKPLIGVSTVTDPKGNTIYYEYDAFNRLKQVKDKDGKILSANEYHYKN